MWNRSVAVAVAMLGIVGALVALGAEKSPTTSRSDALGAMNAGNFKDAYENGFAKLAVDPADDPSRVSDDLTNGINCLRRLGRSDEVDDFREKTVAVHGQNWRLLETAAQTFTQSGENFGFIVAGKFYRGGRRGGDGKQVMTMERDRVRALQLMVQAAKLTANEPDKDAVGMFYIAFSEMVLDNRFGDGAWRLQYLTDLSKLPDYEEGFRYGYGFRGGFGGGFGGNGRGAPVNEDGSPAFH